MKIPVIHRNNFPTTSPVMGGITLWLLLDRIGVSPAWWGVYWTVMTICVASWIFLLCVQQQIDILKDLKK